MVHWITLFKNDLNSRKVGEATAKLLYCAGIAGVFVVVVIISMFGSLNGNILVGPRISYAMAKDKLFLRHLICIKNSIHWEIQL